MLGLQLYTITLGGVGAVVVGATLAEVVVTAAAGEAVGFGAAEVVVVVTFTSYCVRID